MKLLRRILLLAALCCAVTWCVAVGLLWRKKAQDAAFYRERVAPALQENRQRLESWEKAAAEGRSATPPSVSSAEWLEAINESIRRAQAREPYQTATFVGLIGLQVFALAWVLCGVIQQHRARNRWEAPDRPAHPEAGICIAELPQDGFVATDGTGGRVEINPVGRFVTLENCCRVTPISDWHRVSLVTLRFDEILVVALIAKRGGDAILLRTTQGRFLLHPKLKPFDVVANTLIDIAALNRTNPEQYKAARAKEPELRTPWYGWLLLASAIAAVAVVVWIQI